MLRACVRLEPGCARTDLKCVREDHPASFESADTSITNAYSTHFVKLPPFANTFENTPATNSMPVPMHAVFYFWPTLCLYVGLAI